NQTFLSIDQLEQAASKFGLNLDFLHLLFSEADLVEVLRRTIEICKAYCNTVEISQVEKEMYFHVTSATQALMLQLESVNWPVEINVVIDLYKTALSTEQISFYGEPLQGLQVMGILETRTLDFDTVIMTSLNEGVLPSGKSNNSFIPFDVRRHYEMPVHKERDAIYAYHFYRLLQRAKNIHLIYNSASSGLGAKEKSRFILQLQSELNGKGVTYEEKEASIYVKEESLNGLDKMEKTAALKNDILAFLKKGVSPTALSEYVRNPLDFYFNRILGVYDADEIEETIGHATLGSVIHDTLENLYKPFIGTFPERNDFDAIKGKASSELRLNFERHYKKGQMREGKNLLIFQVSETMVNNFLTSDRTRAEGFKKEGRTIQILSLEEMLDRSVYVPELDETIRLRGKADRIEKIGNDIYIIDYKTGSVEQQNLNIKSLEDMYNPDLEKEKVLQLLLYAYMYKPNVQNGQNVYGAVASLRKYKAGILKVRTSEFGRSETLVFEGETEKKFENLLLLKICEMYSGKSYFEDINVISLAKTETQS
ncbi:MAG: PD-(D/E)XK nuclease family protein, partial [Schleiferiaceae bacterium]|nr:PD-(D/E)XK nuclease family protein [Schleiferiaceae bacterium]